MVLSTITKVAGSLLGGKLADDANTSMSKKDYKRQKEFAQNSLSWKIKDAGRHGLHPLEAIGGNGTSYSPLSGPGSAMGDAVSSAANSVGDRLDQKQAQQRQDKVVGSQIDLNKAQENYYNSMAAANLRQTVAMQNQPQFETQGSPTDSDNIKPRQHQKTLSGETMWFPEGPGIDELIVGALMEFGGLLKKGGKAAARTTSKAKKEMSKPRNPMPTVTDRDGKIHTWNRKLQRWE